MGFINKTVFVSLIVLIGGCSKKPNSGTDKTSKLPESKSSSVSETFQVNDDVLLGLPVRLKYHKGILYVQDLPNWAVIGFDDSGNEVVRFGKRGRGPGEIQMLNDFYVTDSAMFIVDGGQFLIHKYELSSGNYISSFDYGTVLDKNKAGVTSHTPKMPLNDINNQPFVTLNGQVLLPVQGGGEFLFTLFDWDEHPITDFGELEESCNSSPEEIKQAVLEGRLSKADKCLAFPVDDVSNPDEFFLVYSSIPKIEKFSFSGIKLWEKVIPATPETDSLASDIKQILIDDSDINPAYLTIRKYISGISGAEGDLYLFTYNNSMIGPDHPIWMHLFDENGELTKRVSLNSDSKLGIFPALDSSKDIVWFPIFMALDLVGFKVNK